MRIPGTPVDYPVVRSDRSEYYLHHLITGQESKLGCLFSLKTSDYETPSKNIAIYGHHLSNSTAMFSSLLEYKKESYWRNHPVIRLKSIYGDRSYRIFAVLNHTVSDWDASTASFKDNSAFLRFVNRAKAKAFYDTGIPVSEEEAAAITKLRPVSFRYISNQKPGVGLIAQELKEVADEYGFDGCVGKAKGYYGIAYRQLIPLMIKQIQINMQKLEELKHGKDDRL